MLTETSTSSELIYALAWGVNWKRGSVPRAVMVARRIRLAVLAASIGLRLDDLTAGVVGVVPADLADWLYVEWGALDRPSWSVAPVRLGDDAVAVAATATALLATGDITRRVTKLLPVARSLTAT